ASRAQHEEVVGRAEALVLEQLGRPGTLTVREAGLHRDHFLHRAAEALRQRRIPLLLADRAVCGLGQREHRAEALALELRREPLDDGPQKDGIEERGRDRLVLAHALVRVRQTEPYELERGLALRSLKHLLRL